MSALGNGDIGAMFTGLVMLVIGGAIPAGSIALFVFGGKSNPEFAPLKANRDVWQKQLMSAKDWQQVLSTPEQNPALGVLSTPAHPQVTQTVRRTKHSCR